LAGLRDHEGRVGAEGPPPQQQQQQQQQQLLQQHAWEGREVHQNARLIEDTDTAIEKISAEVQEMCDLFVSLGGLVEAQAQPIETIQDAAHRAAEKTAAAVGELQTTVEKQGDCLVQ
jgi:t-SNARE complex subunit (syntaxin)